MNDDDIMACILFAKSQNLACADDALEQYKSLQQKAAQHSVQSDGASTCAHTWSLLTAEGLKCIECGHITPRR